LLVLISVVVITTTPAKKPVTAWVKETPQGAEP